MSNHFWPNGLPPVEDPAWLRGVVVRGDGRGRALGFPTANVRLEHPQERPLAGVYAAWALLDMKHLYAAALHIGPRPTFAGARPTVELHLLSFPDRDLYDSTMAFFVVEQLRNVVKFDTIEELKTAIRHDCDHVRRLLPLPDRLP